jgi:glucosylceramidase
MNMRSLLHRILKLCVIGCAVFAACSFPSGDKTADASDVEVWLTTPDRSSLFEKQTFSPPKDVGPAGRDEGDSGATIIHIDTTRTFQSIDGFGYSLTGGSAFLLHQKLTSDQRAALLKELFLTDAENIGISYLRVSIGASDLDDNVFSYDDLPPGRVDKELKNFSLAEDRKNLIPVLKEILALNPAIKIMGSPWSAPVWMKTNNKAKGGSLKTEYYPVYAQYFVKYIEGMAGEGITIDAITLQNEPEHPGNTPSMTMTADEQRRFVKDHLGPAFRTAGIKTRIVVFDHNCDHPEYPIAVLNDSSARQYIDGSAFHLYLGEITALSRVHDAHPDKNIYFTEQWTSGKGDFGGDLRWHVKNLVIGAPRNWSRNVLEWNLAADPEFNPHTDDGGCTLCQGALTIGDSVSRNVSYYIIAHASKFVRPGAVRVYSDTVDGLPNVAFLNRDGRKVLIVLNDSDTARRFFVSSEDNTIAETTLPAGAVATLVW